MNDAAGRVATTVAPERLQALSRRLRVRFRDPALLATALIHTSYSHEAGGPSNERLEFLGDAAIGFAVGEWLFRSFPEAPEGELTWMRSSIVSRRALAGVARRYGVDEFLVLGRGEETRREQMSDSIVGGALEAIIGARLVDGGFGRAQRLALRVLAPELEAVQPGVELRDAKSRLQNLMQAEWRITPQYRVEPSGSGDVIEHSAQVFMGGELLASGHGRKRRDAEQAAAEVALGVLAARLAERAAEGEAAE